MKKNKKKSLLFKAGLATPAILGALAATNALAAGLDGGGGDLVNTVNGTFSGTVTGGTITDGAGASLNAGTVTGTVIGLFQDGLTNLPLGINGIAKAIIGYIAASVGFAVDVENLVNRVAMNFVFCLLQSLLLYFISRFLVADPRPLRPVHELLRAVCNTGGAVPIFFLLDNFRHRD